MTKEDLNRAAMMHMQPGDSFINLMTRFGGGRQVRVRDEQKKEFLIQVNEKGEFIERVAATGGKPLHHRQDSIEQSIDHGEVLFNPKLYKRR